MFELPLTNCFLNLEIVKSLIIIYTNFLIMIFNLLPIYPLDGGRILKGILHINLGKRKAEQYINNISIITIIIITAISSILILYIQNISTITHFHVIWQFSTSHRYRFGRTGMPCCKTGSEPQSPRFHREGYQAPFSRGL